MSIFVQKRSFFRISGCFLRPDSQRGKSWAGGHHSTSLPFLPDFSVFWDLVFLLPQGLFWASSGRGCSWQIGNTAIRQHEHRSWKEKSFGTGDLGSEPELAGWHWRSRSISPCLNFLVSKQEVAVRPFFSQGWHALNELVHVQVPKT